MRKVLVKEVGKPFQFKLVDITDKDWLKKEVGDDVDYFIFSYEPTIDIVFNARHKSLGLEPNIHYFNELIHGAIVFVNRGDSSWVGFSEEEANLVIDRLKEAISDLIIIVEGDYIPREDIGLALREGF